LGVRTGEDVDESSHLAVDPDPALDPYLLLDGFSTNLEFLDPRANFNSFKKVTQMDKNVITSMFVVVLLYKMDPLHTIIFQEHFVIQLFDLRLPQGYPRPPPQKKWGYLKNLDYKLLA
jgi:hypothetical protein